MKGVRLYIKGSYFPANAKMGFTFLVETEEMSIIKTGTVKRKGSALEAEYIGILKALSYLKNIKKGLTLLTILSTNEVMVKQLRGEYKVRNSELSKLYSSLINELSFLKCEWTIRWIPKEEMRGVIDRIPSPFSEEELKKLFDEIDIEEEDIWM